MMNEGLSAADIAAVTGGNNGGFGGWGEGWWIILLFLALGGRGFGFGGGCGCTEAINLQTITSKLDQQTYGMADSTYALNNAINQGFYNTISSQKDCCFETQRMIERGFCDLNNNMNNNTRAILDYLFNQKIEQLRDENQTLKLAASQAKQNNYLVERLSPPTPVPAFITCNPYAASFGYCNGGSGNNF